MTKVQITLTDEEADLLSAQAALLGYNLTKFLKFIIGKKAEKIIESKKVPVFAMSKKAEKTAFEALEEYKKGKIKPVEHLEELVSS